MFVTVEQQQWQCSEDEKRILSGSEFAQLLWDMSTAPNDSVIGYNERLAYTDVGDCIKTGVSAYVRIK